MVGSADIYASLSIFIKTQIFSILLVCITVKLISILIIFFMLLQDLKNVSSTVTELHTVSSLPVSRSITNSSY